MNKFKDFTAQKLTSAEFKAQIISFITSQDFKAELLHQILAALPEDKRAIFTAYRTDISKDPISHDPLEWERGGYFFKQAHIAEENFCLERVKHLIEVKSYLTERGIAGFSRPVPKPTANYEKSHCAKENIMSTGFSSVDLTGFTPSQSLINSVKHDDISSIRNALFMEMNDDHLSTAVLCQAIAWTLSKHANLFVPYEENAYSQGMDYSSEKWNNHYYGMQEVYASSNFSLERIRHMVTVRDHVFTLPKNEASSVNVLGTQTRNTTQKITQQQKQSMAGGDYRADSKHQNNVLNSFLMIGGVVAAIALVILAVIV